MSCTGDTGAHRRWRVAIIGAGLGGLGLAIRLRRAGIDDFVVLEASDGIGGTWRHNTFPGAACDVPSHLYSYSFAPNADWSSTYAGQQEILAYIERCADDFAIRDHVRTGVTITEARWSEERRTWTLCTESGDQFEAAVVVSATGMLNVPASPEIRGVERFDGPCFHSARWQHEHDLTGRRVGVVGTGASAIQIVPEVAPVAGHTTLFARSAPYVMPRRDKAFSTEERELFRRRPIEAKRLRGALFRQHEEFTTFRIGDDLAGQAAMYALDHLARKVTDEELRAKLTPDYAFGCKRVLVSSDFYPAVSRDDVEVVTEPIRRVTARGVETVDGRLHDLDVLVLATGFRATDYLHGIEVYGRGGRRLHETWSQGAFAYLGLTVSGYPNLFVLYGPNTNQGGNSIIFILEAQAAYVVRALRTMDVLDVDVVDVRPEALAAYDAAIGEAMEGTVWASGCRNYFTNDNGRVVTQLPHPAHWYWRRSLRFAAEDYLLTPRVVNEASDR